MNTQQIKNDFYNISKDVKILNEETLFEKYSEFKETFPKLFSMAVEFATSNKEKCNIFEIMISKREDQLNGTTKKMASDLQIGEMLGQTFVYPKIGTPSSDDYKKAIQEITTGKSKEKLEKCISE